tara:strand:- start:300 stop:416 length:117 start_codon:yes stop_codon:yes gene_type:complete
MLAVLLIGVMGFIFQASAGEEFLANNTILFNASNLNAI